MTTCMKTQNIVHYQNGDLAHIILFGIGDISQVDMYTVHGYKCTLKSAKQYNLLSFTATEHFTY